MSSMSDLVFLLLIFFVITSTLVSPNVISLELPSSEAGQQNPPKNMVLYVDSLHRYYVNPEDGNTPGTTNLDTVRLLLGQAALLDSSEQKVVILRADKDVPVQDLVNLMGAVSDLNSELKGQNKNPYKMALATVNPN